jgi:hypothetical protein
MVPRVGMKLNLSRASVCLSVLLLSDGLSQASGQSSGRDLSVDEMTQSAEVIGVATVQDIVCRRMESSNAICTEFTLTVSEVWKGEASTPFKLQKPGGRIGEDALTLPGHEYLVKPGEELVFFAAPQRFGMRSIIGIRQGLYRVGSGPDRPLFRVSKYPQAAGTSSSLTLQGLKKEVWQALGRPGEPPTSPRAPGKETRSESTSMETPKPSDTSIPQGKPVDSTPDPEIRPWAFFLILSLLFAVGIGVIVFRGNGAAKT